MNDDNLIKLVSCKSCGNAFEPASPAARYCCEDCRKKDRPFQRGRAS